MDKQMIMQYILDSIPYPIVFVDCAHVIRYINKYADYHYHEERGYPNLIGRSIFECHNEQSKEMILAGFEKIKKHSNEIFVGVTVKNHRIYMNPVRDEQGKLIGYFERYELNLQK